MQSYKMFLNKFPEFTAAQRVKVLHSNWEIAGSILTW